MIRTALSLLFAFTVVTGIAYPLVITGVSALAFSHQANGSLLQRNGMTVGSSLIGQQFSKPEFFWGRPSATTPAYNAAASSGSNLGPGNPALATAVTDRVQHFSARPPIDLLTTSGSGLDPHISPEAARFQLDRIAQARNLPPDAVQALIDAHTEPRTFGILGAPRVNVLELNLALAQLKP